MRKWTGGRQLELGRVDKRLQPKAGGGEVKEALKGEDGLVVAGSDTAVLLELAEYMCSQRLRSR